MIVLDERRADADVVLHEVAHVVARHGADGPGVEREASELAKRWGADGPAANGDQNARAAEARGAWRPAVSVFQRDGVLGASCDRCGMRCRLFRGPWPDSLGVECATCAFEVVDLDQLDIACPRCGAPTASS